MQPPLAVEPGDLYRAAATLDEPQSSAPPPDVDPGWASTAALGSVTAAVDAQLAALSGRRADLAAALRTAARSYETADDLWVPAGQPDGLRR